MVSWCRGVYEFLGGNKLYKTLIGASHITSREQHKLPDLYFSLPQVKVWPCKTSLRFVFFSYRKAFFFPHETWCSYFTHCTSLDEPCSKNTFVFPVCSRRPSYDYCINIFKNSDYSGAETQFKTWGGSASPTTYCPVCLPCFSCMFENSS